MKLVEKIQAIFKNRSLQQALFVYCGSLVNGASLFGLNVILARSLGKESYGVFSLSVLVLMTVAEMSDFGLSAGLLRFAPYYIATKQDDKLQQLLKIIWRWRISLTFVLTGGCIVLAYPIARYVFGQPEITFYIMYTAIGIGGVILLGLLATFLQAKQRFFYNASLQSLKGFLRLAIVAILYWIGVKSLFAYLSVYILVPWVLFLTNYHLFPKNFRKHVVEEDVKKKLHSSLARFSFWLTVSSLTSILASRVDQAMISHFLGLADVAIFTVAWQLTQLFPIISSSIASVVMPKISSVQTKAELRIMLKKALVWVTAATALVAIAVYPSQYLILLFFGGAYAAAMPVYTIIACGLVLNIFAIPFSMVINVFNQTQLVAYSGIVQVIINVICNFIFIPKYGVVGAALTFVIGVVAQFIWNVGWALYLFKNKELSIE